MPNILIIDYGFGNLHSLAKALTHIGVSPTISQSAKDVEAADVLFLPGVGAFGDGMKGLENRGFTSPIKRHVESGKPIFGICLGMQFLFEWSEEFGMHKGLGLLRGGVKKIIPQKDQDTCKIPQVGWNELLRVEKRKSWDGTILNGVQEKDMVYFVHSYVAKPEDSSDEVAYADYCSAHITAVVERGNIHGTQFHPEKSGNTGLRILENFVKKVSHD